MPMKVFISADIEGITTTTFWDEADPNKSEHQKHAQQMTEEVLAACEGANAAGTTEIIVKDAHGKGNNIDITRLPENVKVIRGWSGHPYSMVEGIDSSFDAAMFVGYHSATSKSGNPMSHTNTSRLIYCKLNGEVTSEFMLFSYAALLENVPSVFLSGDKMLCEDSKKLHPGLITCPVKEGVGAATINYNPISTLKDTKEKAEAALKQDLKKCLTKLPESFELEICYREHTKAKQFSYYPNVIVKNENTLVFKSNDYFEVLRTLAFIN